MKFDNIFKQCLKDEAQALYNYNGNLNDLDSIIELLLNLEGKLVLMGVGKSGLIAQKISATLSSTGTPSFFLHPTEAMHGDLGALDKKDCILAISYSGESEEVIKILPHIKKMGLKIITLSKDKDSKMSRLGDYFLPIDMQQEACPLKTAPTTSTTLTLAMGDAIAICLMIARNFNKNDFALLHPGGSLGRELFIKVSDIMQTKDLPCIKDNVSLKDAIITMTEGRLGNAFFLDSNNKLIGILSDGDLRRAMFDKDFGLEQMAFNYATKSPKTINKEMLAISALNIMKDSKIQILPIVNENNELIGAIHLYMLMQAGFKE